MVHFLIPQFSLWGLGFVWASVKDNCSTQLDVSSFGWKEWNRVGTFFKSFFVGTFLLGFNWNITLQVMCFALFCQTTHISHIRYAPQLY